MSFPVSTSPSSWTSGDSLVASTFISSSKPPVPELVIFMSSLATSISSVRTRDDIETSPSSAGNSSVVGNYPSPSSSGCSAAGHVGGNGLPPERGSTAVSLEAEKKASKEGPSVWDLDHVKRLGTSKADAAWKCLWCNTVFRHWNATKCLYHLAKIVGKDVRICKATHDKKSKELYYSMLKGKDKTLTTLKAREAKFQDMVADGQQSLAIMFEESRLRVSNGCGTAISGKQQVIKSDQTVESSAASQLTMAIADFIHSSGLAFSVTQSDLFKSILRHARCVPASYQPPTRNALSTTLLNINYNNRMQR